ncbi:Ubiquitin carboxyl-terminal hydrolase [Aphelenchoides bicaudatus]|nr:Ubiquitin carboxyl-terminal hydrolase [Aphelenchoides bicaudatus]
MTNTMQYHTIDELKRSAALDSELARRMGQIRESSVLLDKVKSLFKSACDAHNDPEKAYILFSRCNHVCNLLIHCADFSTFTKTPNATRFRDLFSRSMDEFERLENHLKSVYEVRNFPSVPSEPIEVPITRQSDLHPVDRDDFGNFIRPKQLVEYVDNLRKVVLILDYRLKKTSNINYSNANFIRVLPLDLELIAPGLIFNHLRMYIDFRYRPTISEIQNYDLVVLMGDELDNPNSAPFKNGTKTKILLDAITVYNVHNQLKRNPLLLEGGFKAWENTYPMYVEQPTTHDPMLDSLNIHDEFTNLVQMVKQNLGSELVYPELFSQSPDRSKPVLPVKPPATINRNVVEPPNAFENLDRNNRNEVGFNTESMINQMNKMLISDKSQIPRVHSPTKPPTVEEVESSNVLPAIDRSKKPSPPTVSPNMNSTEFPVTVDSDPVPFNKNSCRAEVIAPQKFDKIRPQVPTLGGARMASSPTIVANRPARPAVPERNRIADQEKQQHLLNICHIYERSMYLIDANAARGQVPPGYTGLLNLGNTCFMNSALQALFNTPGMRGIFAQKKFTSYVNPNNKAQSKGMISACYSALIDSVWSTHYRYIRPDNFLNVFAREVNQTLANRHQHDSQEFLSLLVDALHEETNRVEIKKPFEQNYDGKNIREHAADYTKNLHLFASSPINDVFGLRSITQLTCMTCNTSSVTFCDNPLTFLELPLNNGPYCSLKECLKFTFGDDALDGQHKWKCPTCKCPQRTLKSNKIWSLPPVLVICLKRFAMENGDFVKNNINVDFTINDLNMLPYIHKDAGLEIQPRYQLYAMTNHEGTLTSGHYTSIIHNSKTNRWLKFDDDRVSEISPESIQNHKAYILFYRNVTM